MVFFFFEFVVDWEFGGFSVFVRGGWDVRFVFRDSLLFFVSDARLSFGKEVCAFFVFR